MELLEENQIILGRYKVISFAGSGGQSFGFKAEDLLAPESKPWERNVFVKQYRDLICGTPEVDNLRNHFRDLQIKLGEKENYICLPLNLLIESNSVIAIYPWLEGVTLEDYFIKGLTQEQRVRFVYAITNTVKFIHKKDIAHLDLKPKNIVIQENRKDGKLYTRLVDLDAAQIAGIGLREKVIGTPGYSSPEHYFPEKFGKVSTKSDIFALGILISELLFGCHPYIDSPSDYEISITERNFTFPESNYHKDIVKIWAQCLQDDPRKRPTINTLNSTLNKHFKNNLEAVSKFDVWTPPVESKFFLQIEGLGDSSSFRRTYYESQIIGSNELRGIKAKVPSKLFKLNFGRSCSLTLLDNSTNVRIDGKKLRENQTVGLSSRNTVSIESIQLLFKLDSY